MGYSRHILSLSYCVQYAVPRQLQFARTQLPSKATLGALYGPVAHNSNPRGPCTGTRNSNCNQHHHSQSTAFPSRPTIRALSPISNRIRPSQTRSASASTTSIQNAIPKLDLPAIDQKWRSYLTNPPKGPEDAEKFYILPMFPYPSGTLHLGHLRVYTISDVIARFRRMQGYNVVHPMGWDSFGLPAENAAIERGVKPGNWTVQNVERMKEQLGAMMGGFNWERELMTSSPEYYGHTQRLFLLLHRHGLAYRAESLVNWDPIDKTVLANEQVSAAGHSWRSGALVEKKMLKQWFFKITEYADELLNGLREGDTTLAGWPERVKTMQENWIGKSEGAKLKFPVLKDEEREGLGETAAVEEANKRAVEVFTTRVDTLLGAQYLALSHSHQLVKEASKKSPELKVYLEECASKPATNPPTSNNPNDLPKRGFKLPGIFAANPLKPDTFDIPIYAAEYVLEGYGSGAVMGVPAHDIRDNAFFKTHFPPESAPLHVVMPADSESTNKDADNGKVWTKQGILTPNCGPELSGLTSSEAVDKICDTLSLAQRVSQYRLRDWLVSRQRYWGAPIPIIHCPSCGEVPVPDENLPVLLPEDVDISGKGGSPLSTAENGTWADCTCPKCSQPAKRDTDTMDTFVDSSWYFIRFSDSHNPRELFSPEKAKKLLPVDVYIGGVEHAILHLLYSRFISKFLSKIGLWPNGIELYSGEPFRKLLTQGMVHGKTYSDPLTGRFLKPEELVSDPDDPREMVFYRPVEDSQEATSHREPVKPNISFEKMSKSKHNGVDPGLTISTWGSDTTRAHILFAAPVADVVEWDEAKVIGMKRWLGRVWRIVGELDSQLSTATYTSPEQERHIFHISTYRDPMGDIRGWLEKGVFSSIEKDLELLIATCKTINSVTVALGEAFTLNTLVSDLIKLTNEVFSDMTATANLTSLSSQGVSLAAKIVATRSLLALMEPVCPSIVSEAKEWFHGRILERQKAHQQQGHPIKNELPADTSLKLTWPTSSTELLSHLEGLHLHSSSSSPIISTSPLTQSNTSTQTQPTQTPTTIKKIIIQVNSRVKFTLPKVSFPSQPLQSQDTQNTHEQPSSSLLLSKVFTDPGIRKWWFGNSSQNDEAEIPKMGDVWPASPGTDTLQLKDIMIRDSGKVCVVNFVVG